MTGPARQLVFADDTLAHAKAAASGDGSSLDAFVRDAAIGRVTLRAEVLQVKRVAAGSGVSYGHTFVSERETTLALIDIGYGHGLPRKAGNRASVTIAGSRYPIVGRVAMDACVVDIGDAQVAPGDAVTVFGSPSQGAATLGEWAATVGEHPLSVLASLRLDHGDRDSLGIAPLPAGTQLLVSRAALRHNTALMRERVAPSRLIAVVKDDAYGHGLDEAVPTLLDAGVDFFGALDLPTAHRVRQFAPEARVFAWVLDDPAALPAAIAEGIELGVTSELALGHVRAAAATTGRPALVHLKIDTGLHRAGVQAAAWPDFVRGALGSPELTQLVGVWTHIAEASDADDARAIDEFGAAVTVAESLGVVDPLRHLAASAAAHGRADARHDAVRVGAFLYGISPGGGISPVALGLEPAMTLETVVQELWHEGGRSFARLPLGGVHGLPAELRGSAVAAHSKRHLIVEVEPLGTVIEAEGLFVGDTVTIFGSGSRGEATLQELADAAGTIGEELVTRLDRSLARVWFDGDSVR